VREHNERAWLAWHIVAMQKAKRLPKLKKLLIQQPDRRRRQTWQEQMAIMGQWAAVLRKIDDARKALR